MCVEYQRWRVDVTLSTNKAKRILKAYVLLHLGTSDGKVELFEVTLEQFQKFRYAISRSLNEVLKIEQNDQIQRLRK